MHFVIKKHCNERIALVKPYFTTGNTTKVFNSKRETDSVKDHFMSYSNIGEPRYNRKILLAFIFYYRVRL